MQDQLLSVQGAGFPSPDTLQTGSLPLIFWPQALLAIQHTVLRVSALHYSAGDWVLGGFRTVASARALRQPTNCGSEYFYNQCPQVRNLIGTECSLIEVNVGLRRKQAKSNSIDRGIPSEWESDCRSR